LYISLIIIIILSIRWKRVVDLRPDRLTAGKGLDVREEEKNLAPDRNLTLNCAVRNPVTTLTTLCRPHIRTYVLQHFQLHPRAHNTMPVEV